MLQLECSHSIRAHLILAMFSAIRFPLSTPGSFFCCSPFPFSPGATEAQARHLGACCRRAARRRPRGFHPLGPHPSVQGLWRRCSLRQRHRLSKPFFNVVYDDGHNEVMTGNQLAPLLRVDDAAFADPRRWAFDWTIMTMLKVQGFLPQIASYVRSFGLSLPAQWLDLMPDDVDTSTPSMDTAAAFCKRRRFFSPTSIDGPSQTPVRTGLWPTTRTPPLSSCGSP